MLKSNIDIVPLWRTPDLSDNALLVHTNPRTETDSQQLLTARNDKLLSICIWSRTLRAPPCVTRPITLATDPRRTAARRLAVDSEWAHCKMDVAAPGRVDPRKLIALPRWLCASTATLSPDLAYCPATDTLDSQRENARKLTLEPAAMKSSTDNLLPQSVADLVAEELPSSTAPMTDNRAHDEQRVRPCTLRLDSIRKADRNATELSDSTNRKMAMCDPKRAKEFNAKELPSAQWLKTEQLRATLQFDRNANDDSNRLASSTASAGKPPPPNPRRDGLESRCRQAKTDTDESIDATAVTLGDEPNRWCCLQDDVDPNPT